MTANQAWDSEDAGHDERQWVRSERVLWRRLTDGLVLLPLDATEPFVITGSSPAIWDLLARPVDVARAAEALAVQYGLPADVISDDIAPLFRELARRGAIEEYRPSGEER